MTIPTTQYRLNLELVRRRIPNIAKAARSVDLRPATLSNILNGKAQLEHMEIGTLLKVARATGCSLDELVVSESPREETFAETILRWGASPTSVEHDPGRPVTVEPLSESARLAFYHALSKVADSDVGSLIPKQGEFVI